MDIISLIGAIGGLLGVGGSIYCFFFLKQDRQAKEIANEASVIANYQQILATQEQERQRLLSRCEEKNKTIAELRIELERTREKWLSERCILQHCSYRKPPKESPVPQSEADTVGLESKSV